MSSSSLGEIIDRDNELLWGVGLREEAVRFDKHCLHAVRQTLARRIKDPRPALGGLPAQRFDRPSAVFLSTIAVYLGTNLTILRFPSRWGVHMPEGAQMVVGDNYRAKALELLARAETETNPAIRVEFENLAAAYLRLAEQAERNSGLVIDFELPPEDGDPKLKF